MGAPWGLPGRGLTCEPSSETPMMGLTSSRDMLQGTHVCATRAGSRPGESLADITYGFIFHEVLADMRKSLKKAKVLVEVPFDGDLHPVAQEFCCCSELLGPTWADDSTFMCADKDPQCLLYKTEVLCKTVIDECTAKGVWSRT